MYMRHLLSFRCMITVQIQIYVRRVDCLSPWLSLLSYYNSPRCWRRWEEQRLISSWPSRYKKKCLLMSACIPFSNTSMVCQGLCCGELAKQRNYNHRLHKSKTKEPIYAHHAAAAAAYSFVLLALFNEWPQRLNQENRYRLYFLTRATKSKYNFATGVQDRHKEEDRQKFYVSAIFLFFLSILFFLGGWIPPQSTYRFYASAGFLHILYVRYGLPAFMVIPRLHAGYRAEQRPVEARGYRNIMHSIVTAAQQQHSSCCFYSKSCRTKYAVDGRKQRWSRTNPSFGSDKKRGRGFI